MKKLLLFFAAICFAWAAQAQDQTPYKVLRIHNGENITHIIKLADIDSISFQLITPAPPEETYTITVEVDETMGSVTGAGTYKKDDVVTLTATPKEGYVFREWSDGITENPRIIIITGEDIMLTAYFAEDKPVDPFNGHAYVDLGLPSGLLWATCNIGAETPEEYGNYYAWGETETKSTFTENNYAWGAYDATDTVNFGRTKYNKIDNLTVLEPKDDAAIVNWGGVWRMPTKDDFDELIDNCTFSWSNGGCVLTSKKDASKSIFFSSGGFIDESTRSWRGTNGYYWSSTVETIYRAYDFAVDRYGANTRSDARYRGRLIRPVASTAVTPPPTTETYTITVELDEAMGEVTGAGTYEKDEVVTLTATPKEGYKFIEWSDGVTENPRTIVVSENITFVAIFAEEEPADPFNGHAYVDLDLPSGLLWATCNVGAMNPEDYGDYFAWGETTTKSTYNWSTYKYCNGSYSTLTKYCTSSSYGTVDNKTTLDITDDAARANWGGTWRMPTYEEQTELRTECTWSWTTLNGVYGYRVTSKKDTSKSIFLPAAGYRYDSSLYNAGSHGHYWSSSLYESFPGSAYGLDFSSDYYDWYDYRRYYGLSVRPVCKPVAEE